MSNHPVELAKIVADTTKAQNVDWLASDFRVRRAGSRVRISVAISSAVAVLLSPSSGTNIQLNGTTALTAGGVHTFELALDTGRTWNLVTSDAAGTTVRHLVVQEVPTA